MQVEGLTGRRELAIRRRKVSIRRERMLRGAVEHYEVFARLVWRIVEGRVLLWNWHHSLICRELELVSRAETPMDLVICEPPRMLKSYLTSIAFPAWHWLWRPEESVMSVGNDERLVEQHALKARNIITSDLYAELLDIAVRHYGLKSWTLDPSQRVKVNYLNTRGGGRQALGMTSTATGKGCDIQILDDLLDARDITHSSPERAAEICEDAWGHVKNDLSNRFNEPQRARRVGIGQRLHDIDPPGRMIEDGWKAVVLPMRAEPERTDRHPEDHRAAGELLHPARMPLHILEAKEKELGEQAHGQFQQRPQARGGNLFPVAGWMWADRSGYPIHFEREAQGWDLALGGGEGASNSAGFAGGLFQGRVYFTDAEVGQWGLSGQIAALKRLSERRPNAVAKYIEDRANARAVEDVMRAEIGGLILVQPDGDKVARAQAWEPYHRAGQLVLPCRCGNPDLHRHPDVNRLPGEPWAVELVKESASFPKGARKDRVDGSGYLVRPLLGQRGRKPGSSALAEMG